MYIREVYLSDDGENPATGFLPLLQTPTEATVEIFSAEGKRLQTLQPGINIVRTIYPDGTTEVRKQLVK